MVTSYEKCSKTEMSYNIQCEKLIMKRCFKLQDISNATTRSKASNTINYLKRPWIIKEPTRKIKTLPLLLLQYQNIHSILRLITICKQPFGANFFTRCFKAGFHDREILREKLFMRNTDGCTWIIALNSLFASKKFASPVSRIQFYSLRKRQKWDNSIESFMPNHQYFA